MRRPRLVIWQLSLSASPFAAALVIDQPCCSSVLHVPAAFGPDILSMEDPILSRQLVVVDPADACEELKTADLRGKVALVRRGSCNFTDKIYRLQQSDAVAAVVYDNLDRERWGTIMSGVEEWVSRIKIPSVFVSYASGMLLRNTSASSPVDLLISLNGTGHVKPKAKTIGPIETLATYVVVSLVLLSFSGCCGLLLMLCVTCYQRAFRQRALLTLRTTTFRKRRRPLPGPSTAALERHITPPSLPFTSSSDNRSSPVASSSSAAAAAAAAECVPDLVPAHSKCGLRRLVDGLVRGGATIQACWGRTMGREEPPAEPWEGEEQTCCAICLEDYEDDDVLRMLPCGHGFHDACVKPWLLDKSDTCPLCKRPAFRHVSSLRYGDEQSMEPLASAASDQASGFVDFPLHPISLEALALDDIGNFLQQNSCLFALLLVAVVSSATVLGLAAIIKG